MFIYKSVKHLPETKSLYSLDLKKANLTEITAQVKKKWASQGNE